MIELYDDFRDLLIALADVEAEFVVVGGHAVAYHGHPRATKDLDVLVRANDDNARRVYAARSSLGRLQCAADGPGQADRDHVVVMAGQELELPAEVARRRL